MATTTNPVAWDAPWNGLTMAFQLATDNDIVELTTTERAARRIAKATKPEDGPEGVSIEFLRRANMAEWLIARYVQRIGGFNPDSKVFTTHLAGVLLHECVNEINWYGLAQHYIDKAKEGKK